MKREQTGIEGLRKPCLAALGTSFLEEHRQCRCRVFWTTSVRQTVLGAPEKGDAMALSSSCWLRNRWKSLHKGLAERE